MSDSKAQIAQQATPAQPSQAAGTGSDQTVTAAPNGGATAPAGGTTTTSTTTTDGGG
jgi:hypothetical protein